MKMFLTGVVPNESRVLQRIPCYESSKKTSKYIFSFTIQLNYNINMNLSMIKNYNILIDGITVYWFVM